RASGYNGLTPELRKRFANGFAGALAYTYGKVTDTVPDATAVVPASADDATFTYNPGNFCRDADAKFAHNAAAFGGDDAGGVNDQRQRLVLSGLWALPYWQGTDGWRRYVL